MPAPEEQVSPTIVHDATYRDLHAAIQQIRAIDHHSHALPARRPEPAESERPDPLGQTPFPYPARLRVTNPEYVAAWRALYGYEHEDMTGAHAREALRAKLRIMEQKGVDYPAWVLDQAGIEVIFVNMPRLGPGQTSPRFLWVAQADGLLSPFDGEIGRDNLPATLNEYLASVVKVQLGQRKAAGAVAVKFGMAYRRSLDVANVPPAEAESIYERCIQGGTPSARDDQALQDFIFRAVAREAGRLELAVHIHTGVGADPYFNIGGSNPLLLESAFNDETLRQTTFVMLHGGWPFERQAGVMLMKPNVYADFSSQTFLRSTRALAATLEEWLEWYPEKVLFGTDAYSDDTPLANWEEKLWLTTRTAREALALALTRMIRAGQITRPRAVELAHLVLRDNALRLYELEKH
jgi:hypothetical protein